MILPSSRVRLRPSVSVVPFDHDHGVQCEFFLGNTRRLKRYILDPALFDAIRRLDGSATLEEAAGGDGPLVGRLLDLIEVLLEACIVEPMDVSEQIDGLATRRVGRFLQDYFPGHEALGALSALAEARVVILGVGGVGSWVAHLLARSGIGELVLADDDVVDLSNLNRSLFDAAGVGMPKVDALAAAVDGLVGPGRPSALRVSTRIESEASLTTLLDGLSSTTGATVVVNCADHPNVDETARMVGRVCLLRELPHVIAGGYNLHLSLVGPTILPHESACVECIRIGLDAFRPLDHDQIRKIARKSRKIGSLGPLVAVGASYVANEVMRCVLSGPRLRPAMVNRRAEVNFLTGELSSVDLPRRADCSWCGSDVPTG